MTPPEDLVGRVQALEQALADIRRAVSETRFQDLQPASLALIVARVDEVLPPKARRALTALPMRCQGGKADPSGGCWHCAAPPGRWGARCPSRGRS